LLYTRRNNQVVTKYKQHVKTMDISSIYPDDSGYIFDSMVESMDSLFLVKTADTERLAEQLSNYQYLTGRAAYRWHAHSGIKRFDLQHIILPNTQQLIDALYHISNSPHFGIFLFTGFDKMLFSPMTDNVIQHFLESARAQRKYIIFADPDPAIPSSMQHQIVNLNVPTGDKSQNSDIRTSYLYSR
jgi:hypothetical protein